MVTPIRSAAALDRTLAVLRQLQGRDSVVRSHEAAHLAAGGGVVTGGARFSYQKGPDGRQYAVGGEVGIDLSPVAGNPRATVQKMQTVRAAALAPAQPSPQDLSVAAAATQQAAQARLEAYRRTDDRPEPGSLVDLEA